MGFFSSIWNPQSFLGFTDLKTGALILGLLSLVFALIAILDTEERKTRNYICSLVPIVFSILFVVVCCSVFVHEKHKFSIGIFWTIFFVLYLLESLYTWRVVNAYNNEMKGK